MSYGLVKLGAYSPCIKVADPSFNARGIIETVKAAETDGVAAAAFPELSVTGYTCGDLFLQTRLAEAASEAVGAIAAETAGTNVLFFVGAPVAYAGKLFNCAAAICAGKILGVIPKVRVPNYGEFYERRHFVSGEGIRGEVRVGGQTAPIAPGLIFSAVNVPGFSVTAEICEDLWALSPPSERAASEGAAIVMNLSASNETVGKAGWRRTLVSAQSGRAVCAYVYADAGLGESTGDMVFAAHDLIAVNGVIAAECPPLGAGQITAVVDLETLAYERRRVDTFVCRAGEAIPFTARTSEIRPVLSRTPFVPESGEEIAARAELILGLQAAALAKRLEHTGAGAVLGVSGGLDSALALLVTARAFRLLKREVREIVAVCMPGLGTGSRTRKNAAALIEAVGASARTIDITKAVRAHFKDIGHDEATADTVYENAQARERTQILMDIANGCNALVIGTGDLSEAALGWSTYNGDHMSMYNVNCAVPKTLVKYLIAAEAARDTRLTAVLEDILDTEISPELVPATDGRMQSTEDRIGKYELNDFFLYYVVRYGFTPKKVLFLAECAFTEMPPYALKEALRNFYKRFFTQQFKRSAVPDGVKIGSVSLSPRADWRMPSDAEMSAWTDELDTL